MAKDKITKLSPQVFADLMLRLRKCDFCKGKDGKKKDVYETFQAALDTAQYIEENRGISLNIYQCPRGNGWHLTKTGEAEEFHDRKDSMFLNNDIPLSSSDGSWLYVRDEANENNENNYNKDDRKTAGKKQSNQSAPIHKVECKPEKTITELAGKVMEIVKNVDIEKIFRINMQNPFGAVLTKNILDGIVNQITIFAENSRKNRLDSYTVLIKNDLQKNIRLRKGTQVKMDITGKSINNVNMWCCKKITAQQ
jgi:hypothetical protein